MQEKITRYYNGRILHDHKLAEGELWVRGGKIVAPEGQADVTVDLNGLMIAPGYVDIQINGGFGVDFSSEPERVAEVAKQLPRYGVTAFLPTVITSSKKHYLHALPHLQQQNALGAKILGIHLEGPFLNPQYCGAHNPHFLQTFHQIHTPEEIYGSLEGVKMVTLAPELEGAARIMADLRAKGIVISAGHTCATLQQMEEAILNGLSCVTHLFNAMPPFHQREPGVVGAVLTHKTLPYSLIADPHHLHRKTMELAWRAHPKGLILVSDAMKALGLSSGTYRLGTIDVEVEEGRALLQGTQTLAGSVIGLDSAVRYLRASAGCSQVEAIEAATLKPAELLGVQHQKGTLQEGADADFNLLDENLYVQACYINGKLFPGIF